MIHPEFRFTDSRPARKGLDYYVGRIVGYTLTAIFTALIIVGAVALLKLGITYII